MGTRSNIGRQQDDGTIKAIYCHWDGYPDGVGKTLVEHYQDPTKIDALLELGDLSTLAGELGEAHDFDNDRRADWCLAYGRDRGETGVEAKTYPFEGVYMSVQGLDYQYLWRDGQWLCRRARHGQLWQAVTELLEVEE